MQKRDEGMVVLTVCVGRYGYISLSGFPTTFIIDMALSAPRFRVHDAGSTCAASKKE